MLSTLFGGWAIFARARQLISGPMSTAIGATLVVVVLVGSVALGLAWLRGDATRDAVAVCEADKLQAELERERARFAALEAAQRERDATIARLTEQRRLDATVLSALEQEREDALQKAKQWEEAAGRGNSAVFRRDDPWLRQR